MHRFQDRRDGERRQLRLQQQIAALEIDDVFPHRAQSERGGADESELTPLQVGDRTALAALDPLGQAEDRGERRVHVVGNFHEELQAFAPEVRRQRRGTVGAPFTNSLDGEQQDR